MFIFIILLVLLSILLLVQVVHQFKSNSLIKKEFDRCNVIVGGAMGTGKDAFFQHCVNIRKKSYLSNMNYGSGKKYFYSYATPNALELKSKIVDSDGVVSYHSLTYEDLINDTIQEVVKDNYPYEDRDFYFSDCGIILPSQYDYLLNKKYKTLPVAYALSRQLWNNHIHCNTQNIERIWKPLREQADIYIITKKCSRFFKWLRITYYTYDKYSSAVNKLMPFERRFGKDNKREYEKYTCLNGLIEKHIVYVPIKKIKYDTRQYHKYIFGIPAPIKIKKLILKLNKKKCEKK